MSPARLRQRSRALLLLPVLLAPALAVAADLGGFLRIIAGPNETSWLRLKELAVKLDGSALPVTLPPAEPGMGQLVYAGPVRPGTHQLDVVAGYAGDSRAFSYVKDYVFRMQGQLQLDASGGEAVIVELKAVAKKGLTVEWTDRFKMSLVAAAHRPLEGEELAAASGKVAAAPAEPNPAELAPTPPPDAVMPPPTCALQTPRFRTGKAELDPPAREALVRFAACLATGQDPVELEGFADPRGPAAFNQRLSEQRAKAVAGYLTQRGVAASRLTVRGFGATRLLCTEPSADCWSRNRRVEAVTAGR